MNINFVDLKLNFRIEEFHSCASTKKIINFAMEKKILQKIFIAGGWRHGCSFFAGVWYTRRWFWTENFANDPSSSVVSSLLNFSIFIFINLGKIPSYQHFNLFQNFFWEESSLLSLPIYILPSPHGIWDLLSMIQNEKKI